MQRDGRKQSEAKVLRGVGKRLNVETINGRRGTLFIELVDLSLKGGRDSHCSNVAYHSLSFFFFI